MSNDLASCTGKSKPAFTTLNVIITVLFNVEKKNTPTQDEILKLLESSDDKVEHSHFFSLFADR